MPRTSSPRRTSRPPDGRPVVVLNMAMSADGKIATANRAIESFGSPADQAHLYDLRATADAVLCGARTADGPDISLGPGGPVYQRRRLRRGLSEFPVRVIASGRGNLRPDAGPFHHTFSPVIVLASRRAPAARLVRLRRVATAVGVFGADDLDLRLALRWLRRVWGIRRLICEGGAELNAAMFRQGLIDEVHVTICPRIFGGRAAPTLADGVGVGRLAEGTRLVLERVRKVGDELFLVYRVISAR